MRLAAAVMRPSVVDFLELSFPGRGAEIDLEEIRVAAGSALAGQSITAVEQSSTRLRIVALKRGDPPSTLIPDPVTRIAAGAFPGPGGYRPTPPRPCQRRGNSACARAPPARPVKAGRLTSPTLLH